MATSASSRLVKRKRPAARRRTFHSLIAGRTPKVRRLARATRRFLRQLLPDTHEVVDSSAPLIAFTRGDSYAGMVCTMMLSASGVKIGIFRGAELADPYGLLEGSGKMHRHVRLVEVADLRRPGVTALVRASDKAARVRQAARRVAK
jgi:hypothetical protein